MRRLLSQALSGESRTQVGARWLAWWCVGVRSVERLTALEALDEARALFAGDPAMLAVIEADLEAIPGLVRIEADSDRIDSLVTEVQVMPEIGRVVLDETTVELLEAGLEASGVTVQPEFDDITTSCRSPLTSGVVAQQMGDFQGSTPS